MSMHPLMTEPVVAGRMADRQREAAARRKGAGPGEASAARTRRSPVARHAGGLLITIGRRLAGPDYVPGASRGSHRWT